MIKRKQVAIRVHVWLQVNNASKMAQYLHVSFQNQVASQLKLILLYGPIISVKRNIENFQEPYE
jgi:hypothetical protein